MGSSYPDGFESATVFSAGPPATGAATIFIEYEPLVVGAIVA